MNPALSLIPKRKQFALCRKELGPALPTGHCLSAATIAHLCHQEEALPPHLTPASYKVTSHVEGHKHPTMSPAEAASRAMKSISRVDAFLKMNSSLRSASRSPHFSAEVHCFMGWQESLKSSSSCRKHRETPAAEGKAVKEIKCGSRVAVNLHVLTHTHYTSWGPGKKNFSHGFLFPGKRDSPEALPAVIPSHHDERSLGRQKPSNSRGGGSLNFCSGTTRLFAR